MNQAVKAGLDLFVAIAVLVAFGQDLYKLTWNSQSAPIQPNNQVNNTTTEEIPLTEGVTIYVTDNLRRQLHDLLVAEKYNIKMQAYKFQGQDWWIQNIINYGNIVLIFMLMSRHQSETNQQTKKKIMYIGIVLVLGWMLVLPQFKQMRVKVQVKGVSVYTKNKIVPNEIISAINDESYLQSVVSEDDEF